MKKQILKTVFNYAGGGGTKSNCKIKIRFFFSFILIFNLRKLEKETNKYYFTKLSFKPFLSKKKEAIYLLISLTIIQLRGFHVYMICFCLAYYLNLLQAAEKQTKVEVS